MKKQVLKLSEKVNYTFKVIGISSHENDYRICWAINSQLHFDFKKTESHCVYDKSIDSTIDFSLFEYIDEESFLRFFLVANRNEKGVLIPELKNIDYFIMISGEVDSNSINSILSNIKKINIVSTALLVDLSTLKSKKNLVINL